MPKKNSLIIPQEKEVIEDELTKENDDSKILTKSKRPVSDAQRAHLNNIRVKALEKKAQMKEETLKGKLAKVMEKKELVKKYDDYVEQKEEAVVKQKEDVVVKQKKEKKIIYKYASSDSSSSSSDENEDEKIVYVKKCKKKNKSHVPPRDVQPAYSGLRPSAVQHHQQTNNSLDSTLYKSSQEMLHHRAIEERVKSNLMRWNIAMMPQEY